ncbi:DUF2490 domain-containing protein [Sphingobacteriales bacterium UPWRP_1]|nr:hypothetical protein BVG80_04670 [Sphingobacteriales bacterium TSM_CSM]PSJ73681.1 DUF2490 domain-containing protein [Sphingobacteriales bacterium UPWRP_1]
MSRRCLFAMLLLCCITLNRIVAQKSVMQQQQLWYAYYNTLVINKKWQLLTDVQERHFINPVQQHQFLVRTHLHYRTKTDWSLGAGGSLFIVGNPVPGGETNLMVPELRPHIEFNHKTKSNLLGISHRYRFEARFFHNTAGNELASGYQFGNFRVRYRLGIELPLKLTSNARTPLKLKIADEVHLNFGKNITYNTFDQNRIYLSLSCDLLPDVLSLETGYLNWFQQRTTGNAYFMRHIFYLSVQQKISLLPKSPP